MVNEYVRKKAGITAIFRVTSSVILNGVSWSNNLKRDHYYTGELGIKLSNFGIKPTDDRTPWCATTSADTIIYRVYNLLRHMKFMVEFTPQISPSSFPTPAKTCITSTARITFDHFTYHLLIIGLHSNISIPRMIEIVLFCTVNMISQISTCEMLIDRICFTSDLLLR